MVFAGRPRVAGPCFTEPSSIEYWLPWQLQLIVPPSTLASGHCWCWQTELNPLNSPDIGWVTTTPAEAKTLPPPTGISLVLANAAVLPPPGPGDESPAELSHAPI